MTRDEIDTLWQKAMHKSVKAGEQFTRYHFAEMVAKQEREACAVLAEESDIEKERYCGMVIDDGFATKHNIAAAIRARGET